MEPLTLGLILAGANAGAQGLQGLGQYLASRQQMKAADKAVGTVQDYYKQGLGYQQPYYQAGQTGLNQLLAGQGYDTAVPTYDPGQVPGPYQAEQFNFQADPSYAFRRQEGIAAGQAGAAGAGTGLSGATLKALARYGSNLASQEYGNAFDRYMRGRGQGLSEYQTNLGRAQDIRDTGWGAQKDIYKMGSEQAMNRYNRAAGLAGLGEAAASRMGTMATGLGENLANIYGQKGNAQAAGTSGAWGSAGGALSGIGQGLAMGQYLGNLGQGGYSSLGSTPRARAQQDIYNKYGV